MPLQLLLLCLFSPVLSFNFTYSTPSACDPFTVSWTGGFPPFRLLITPAFGVSYNISIPQNALSSFTTTLNLNATQRFVITMSDATGFASGGISPILTATPSVSGTHNSSCYSEPALPFTFQANLALRQCSYVLSLYHRLLLYVNSTHFYSVHMSLMATKGQSFPSLCLCVRHLVHLPH